MRRSTSSCAASSHTTAWPSAAVVAWPTCSMRTNSVVASAGMAMSLLLPVAVRLIDTADPQVTLRPAEWLDSLASRTA